LHKQVQALVAAGLVEPLDRHHRGIRLAPEAPAPDILPFLGKIAAGRPIEALPQTETIQIPPRLRTARPCYVLQVTGDSMCEAGILDGDYVVIEHRQTAHNGESVVAPFQRPEFVDVPPDHALVLPAPGLAVPVPTAAMPWGVPTRREWPE
jgi:repressor LexA